MNLVRTVGSLDIPGLTHFYFFAYAKHQDAETCVPLSGVIVRIQWSTNCNGHVVYDTGNNHEVGRPCQLWLR